MSLNTEKRGEPEPEPGVCICICGGWNWLLLPLACWANDPEEPGDGFEKYVGGYWLLLPVLKEMLLLKKQEPLPIEGIWDNCLNIVWFMMVLSLVLQVQWACFLDIRTAARSRNIGVYRGYPSLKHPVLDYRSAIAVQQIITTLWKPSALSAGQPRLLATIHRQRPDQRIQRASPQQ